MAMQYDVKSAYLDASGDIFDQPTRVKGIYIYLGASAGTLEIKDGGSGGTVLIKMATPASASANPIFILIPGEGVRFSSKPYAALSNVAAITVFYG